MDDSILFSITDNIKLCDLRNHYDDINQEKYDKMAKYIKEHNIKSIIKDDKQYHHKFYSVKYNPKIIYYMGNIELLNNDILGIVGPRKNSEYSKRVLEKLFDEMNNYNLATISGLAPGVDTYSHQLSIQNKIPTIAVLGGGLRYYLNSKRRELIEKIIENGGLVISEFKIGFVPTNYSFPQRNRIISGLSNCLFLPEAGEKSGSLITANISLSQKKDVWISPNNIFEDLSKGSNKLLKDKNINIMLNFEEMLCKYFDTKDNEQKINTVIHLSDNEKKVLTQIVNSGEIDIGELSIITKFDTQDTMHYLTILEMNNLIYQNESGNYLVGK